MRYLLLLFLALLSGLLRAQTQADSTIVVFSGFVYSADSVPVENAYLINYRTLRTVKTDSLGHFATTVYKSDSLMISHITFGRKMVFANDLSATKNEFYLDAVSHIIPMVSTIEREQKNFSKNMEMMKAQMQPSYIPPPLKKEANAPANIYAPGANNIGFGFNFIDLFKLLKKRKKK